MKKFVSIAALLLINGIVSGADIPRKAPDLTIPLPDGKQVKLSDYKGKVVVLMFILTTCPHCQKTTQGVSGLQNELGPKGFQALAAAFNPDAAAGMPGFIQNFHPTFPVGVLDPAEPPTFMQLNPAVRNFVPFMAFIDRQGMIRAQYTGGEPFLADEAAQEKNIRDEALKLLAEPVKKAK